MTLVAHAVAPTPRAVIYMSHAVPRRLLQELQAGLVAGEPVLLGARLRGLHPTAWPRLLLCPRSPLGG